MTDDRYPAMAKWLTDNAHLHHFAPCTKSQRPTRTEVYRNFLIGITYSGSISDDTARWDRVFIGLTDDLFEMVQTGEWYSRYYYSRSPQPFGAIETLLRVGRSVVDYFYYDYQEREILKHWACEDPDRVLAHPLVYEYMSSAERKRLCRTLAAMVKKNLLWRASASNVRTFYLTSEGKKKMLDMFQSS